MKNMKNIGINRSDIGVGSYDNMRSNYSDQTDVSNIKSRSSFLRKRIDDRIELLGNWAKEWKQELEERNNVS